MERTDVRLITCRCCGEIHHPVALRLGERAVCRRCGSDMARRRVGAHVASAFTVTALVLAIPSLLLPFVTIQKLGMEHVSYLTTGVRALWTNHMPLIAVWVAVCGIGVPIALLGTLSFLIVARGQSAESKPIRFWSATARAMQRWSMPEVQVLAVLVAFAKIGALVHLEPGPGLWFYAAMAGAMLVAWRTTEVGDVEP